MRIRRGREQKGFYLLVRKNIWFEGNMMRDVYFISYWVPHSIGVVTFLIAQKDTLDSRG